MDGKNNIIPNKNDSKINNKENDYFLEKETVKFSKEQFLKSKRYKNHKDLINVLFKDDGYYSILEAEKMINSYLKGVVV